MSETLPQFPTDDATLLALEHALQASYDIVDGEPVLVGADYSLFTLLNFLSGYDESKEIVEDDDGSGILHVTYPYPVYHYTSVIAALICEVRRLREELAGE